MRRAPLLGNIGIVLGVCLLILAAAHVATGLRAQAVAFPTSAPFVASRSALSGEPVGRLEIPRVGLDMIVFEGTSDATLRKGPGHLPGTAWPAEAGNEAGNCVIAGHRDSFFRRLRSVREGDVVRLIDPSSVVHTYRLESKRIVGPEDVSVTAPTTDARLTLITCYPFAWIGSAPQRLVWSARPISSASAEARAAEGSLRTRAEPKRSH